MWININTQRYEQQCLHRWLSNLSRLEKLFLSNHFLTDGWQSIEVLRAHIRELQTEIESKDAEIVRLRQSFADLVGIQNGGEKTHYTWIEFVAAGTASIGKTKGFQLAFLDCNPEYSSGDLSAWRRLDKVPADAMTRLTALKMKVDSSRGQSWTPEEYDYLQSVLNETPKIKMLALSKLLSQKFGR
ncbi:unnamed protein product, partial [Sphagnum tenellum]